jgi:hypothetical protein
MTIQFRPFSFGCMIHRRVGAVRRPVARRRPALEHLENRLVLSAPSFAAPVDVPVGTTPSALAVGDFSGDHLNDIVTANEFDSTVSVLLNNGDGTFARTDVAVGDSPQAVAVGDFNQDGKLDLAVANANQNPASQQYTVSVLLNNGTGATFTRTDVAVGTNPVGVAVGDFNGDGKADIVAVNLDDQSVSVLLNQGSGTSYTRTDVAVDSDPGAVAVWDFNGDGKADIATANRSPSTVTVLRNNGNGTSFTRTDVAAGDRPLSVAAGDFNGDGDSDIATSNFNNTVSVLLSQGTGTSFTRTDIDVGPDPLSVAVGDFDGDGKGDIVTADWDVNNFTSSATVLANNGNGTFTRADFAVGDSPGAVAVGDLDGDGLADLAIANRADDTVSVLRNTSTTAASPAALIAGAIATVPTLSLPGNSGHGIVSSLDAAEASLTRGNSTAARNQIQAAIQKLQADVKAQKLDASAAAPLITQLQSALALI